MFVNLTEHDVTVIVNGKKTVIKPSGSVARINNFQELDRIEEGIPITKNVFYDFEGLPEGEKGKTFIVSNLVRKFLSIMCGINSRPDVVSPNTEIGCIKEGKKVVAVTRFNSN